MYTAAPPSTQGKQDMFLSFCIGAATESDDIFSIIVARNGGALIFARFRPQFTYRLTIGRNRRHVRSVSVGPLGGADRRLIGFGNRRSRRRFTHGNTRQFCTRKNHHRSRDGHLHPVAAHPG